MANSSAHFNKGKSSNIAFVFSCPGQEEMNAKRPVNGITGANLEILLGILKENKFIEDFQSRYDFRITNAFSKVLFKEKDQRTEATLSEIYEPKNIKRLYTELEDISDVIICFGRKALKAVQRVNKTQPHRLKPHIISSCHLGLSSLNRVKVNEEGSKATRARLTLVANNIISQWD